MSRGEKVDWELWIPLSEGGFAKLSIPIPITQADHDVLQYIIPKNLDSLRRSIVSEPEDRAAEESP